MRANLSYLFLAALFAHGTARAGELVVPPRVPHAVADADGTTLFVTDEKARVAAIDLKTGETLWTSTDAQRPLALTAKGLLAQATDKENRNALRLVVLDPKARGKLAVRSPALEVPEGYDYDFDRTEYAEGGAPPGLFRGTVFRIRAALEDGTAVVSWSAIARGSGRNRYSRRAEGSWRFDLTTGAVKKGASAEHTDPAPTVELPSTWGSEPFARPAELNKRLEVPSGTPLPSLHSEWLRDGTGHALVLRHPVGDEVLPGVTLHRWEAKTGTLQDPFLLARVSLVGKLVVGSHFGASGVTPAADGRTVFVVPSADTELEKRALLFSAATGKKVAEIAFPNGQIELVADDGFALVTRASERAKGALDARLYDTATGKEVRAFGVTAGDAWPANAATRVVGIVGPRVYFVKQQVGGPAGVGTATELTAFDTVAGKKLWSVPLANRTRSTYLNTP